MKNLLTLSSLISPVPLIQPRQRLIGSGGSENAGGKCMPMQLDCTTRIESTENNGIYGIHFNPQMTFSRLSHLAIKGKSGLIDILGMAWTALKANHYV